MDAYTFAEQKPPEGDDYTHSKKIAFRLFELEWVYTHPNSKSQKKKG
jgi:hypothetical protein